MGRHAWFRHKVDPRDTKPFFTLREAGEFLKNAARETAYDSKFGMFDPWIKDSSAVWKNAKGKIIATAYGDGDELTEVTVRETDERSETRFEGSSADKLRYFGKLVKHAEVDDYEFPSEREDLDSFYD